MESAKSLNPVSLTGSSFTMVQMTDLIPNSIEASIHTETSMSGSGRVCSQPNTVLIAPRIPSVPDKVLEVETGSG
jgi:hypothetical protein